MKLRIITACNDCDSCEMPFSMRMGKFGYIVECELVQKQIKPFRILKSSEDIHVKDTEDDIEIPDFCPLPNASMYEFKRYMDAMDELLGELEEKKAKLEAMQKKSRK